MPKITIRKSGAGILTIPKRIIKIMKWSKETYVVLRPKPKEKKLIIENE